MAVTIGQEQVFLVSPCRNGRVEWHWPVGAEVVTVTSDTRTEVFSIEEAHDLFDTFLSAGWR
jgi:hypothetical protein